MSRTVEAQEAGREERRPVSLLTEAPSRPAEPPAPRPPTAARPHGAQSPVGPGCDCEGNRPPGPPAPNEASPSSDPGIEVDLGSGTSGERGRRSSQELSSPGSDSEAGAAHLGRMISSISETELELSSSSGRSSHLTNSIEEASSPASEPEPEAEPEAEAEPLPPRRPAFLPVGPEDTNSEYESGSESEPDLSEDADSPWLLSNLVSRMISEGSSPILCPGQCLSPAPRPPGEPGSPAGGAPEAAGPGGVELVDMETLCGPPPPAPPAPRAGTAQPGPCLFLSNPTRDTITPLWAAPGRAARAGRACSSACSEEDEDEEEEEEAEDQAGPRGGSGAGPQVPLDASLVYDAVKYTLVVDEHTQLELVSLRRCGLGSGEDSGEASEDEAATLLDEGQGPEGASPDSPDLTFSKKFLNVFVNSTSRSSSEWTWEGGGSRPPGSPECPGPENSLWGVELTLSSGPEVGCRSEGWGGGAALTGMSSRGGGLEAQEKALGFPQIPDGLGRGGRALPPSLTQDQASGRGTWPGLEVLAAPFRAAVSCLFLRH